MYIGLDTGNFDVKTPNNDTPSGYKEFSKKPSMVDEVLFYNGKYYVPTGTRFTIEDDKTKNERFFILSLIAISKEIIFKIERKKEYDMQKEISKVKVINIGAGLPPAHMEAFQEKYKRYYLDEIGNSISYTYNNYKFEYRLGKIMIFPQDVVAIMDNKSKSEIEEITKFPFYYGIDIGGGTFDVVAFVNGKLDSQLCMSRPLGSIQMTEYLKDSVARLTGENIDAQMITSVLRKEPTLLSDDIVKAIKDTTQEWTTNALNILLQADVRIDLRPCVFLGGTSRMLKPFILDSNLVKKCAFIKNPRANAIAYQKFLMTMMK